MIQQLMEWRCTTLQIGDVFVYRLEVWHKCITRESVILYYHFKFISYLIYTFLLLIVLYILMHTGHFMYPTISMHPLKKIHAPCGVPCTQFDHHWFMACFRWLFFSDGENQFSHFTQGGRHEMWFPRVIGTHVMTRSLSLPPCGQTLSHFRFSK